jgi:hypothetical protein
MPAIGERDDRPAANRVVAPPAFDGCTDTGSEKSDQTGSGASQGQGATGPARLQPAWASPPLLVRLEVNQLISHRVERKVGDRIGADLLHRCRTMGFDGLDTEFEQRSDSFVRLAFGDQLGDLPLARGERLEIVCRFRMQVT